MENRHPRYSFSDIHQVYRTINTASRTPSKEGRCTALCVAGVSDKFPKYDRKSTSLLSRSSPLNSKSNAKARTPDEYRIK